MRNLLYTGLLLLLYIMIGCSESSPVIEQVDWRVIHRNQDFQREELYLFVRMSDPDDDDDPNLITVIAEGTGFQWNFSRSEWIFIETDGGDFWGMPGMIPYSGKSLPNVLYTVRLTDLAGQTDETKFRLTSDRVSITDINWPVVNVSNGVLRYSGKYDKPVLILRSSDMDMIHKTRAFNGYALPAGLRAVWWEIWISLDDKGSGIRIGPRRLPVP